MSSFQPFDGYTDKDATEKKLVRDAFKDGDVWFNTGDLMRSQGFGHAAFTDRLGDTFRWKGENVATTEVEAAVVDRPAGRGVPRSSASRCAGAGGKAGMAAIQLKDGQEFDGKALAKAAYEHLPGYAVPLFVRVVERAGAHVDVQEPEGRPAQAGLRRPPARATRTLARSTTRSTCWPAATRATSTFYDEYPAEVADGKRPKG